MVIFYFLEKDTLDVWVNGQKMETVVSTLLKTRKKKQETNCS